MQPEERLDILISQRQSGDVVAANDDITRPGTAESASSDWINRGHAGESDPLLAAADRFAVWGNEDPAPAFADRLETELLARFAVPLGDIQLQGAIQGDAAVAGTREERRMPAHEGALPGTLPQPHVDMDGRRQPQNEEDILHQQAGTTAGRTPRPPLLLLPRRLPQVRTSRLLGYAAAAAVLFIIGSSALAAAALAAGPGQALYGMHRLEQGAWTDLATSPDERVRLHLQYAQEALGGFDTAVAQHANSQADRDALATFEQESQAAADGIASLPASDTRTALAAQLATLRGRAEQELLAALPKLDWSLRADVTVAIGQLGVSVPHVTQAAISGTSHDGNYLWTVTVTGSGFAPDAVLLIDGRPIGTVISRSTTSLVVQINGNQLSDGTYTVGVGNPDGTASIVTGITSSRAADDHGGSGGSGGGSSGGGDNHGGSGGDGSGGGGSSGGGSGSGDGSGSGHGGSSGSASPTPTVSPTATPDNGGH